MAWSVTKVVPGGDEFAVVTSGDGGGCSRSGERDREQTMPGATSMFVDCLRHLRYLRPRRLLTQMRQRPLHSRSNLH